jgi:hypothetical protein
MRLIFSLFFTIALFSVLSGQTCCSSGIPIASNLGFQSKGKNILQFSLGWDHNKLGSLFAGNEKLTGNNRLRITNAVMSRLAFGFTDNFQIELLVPYVGQYRQIKQNNGKFNEEGGFGLGDITLMPQIDIISTVHSSLNFGLGLKLPTGSNDIRNSAGFLLINDLQLGTNSYDVLLRFAFVHAPSFRPSSSLFLNSILVYKGNNNQYLGAEKYKFGNEIQFNLGYSDQLFLIKTLLYPTISVRIRKAVRDKINDNLIHNTGGSWVFGRIGFGIDLFQNTRINISGEYPLYTKVDGTQLSPDYIFNLSFYKMWDLNPNPE